MHLRESVAAQIRAAASAPQESRAGLERGGILWGRVRDAGEDYYLISIEYAEHLSCDHTHGEGWVPSEKERKYLRKRLKQGYGDLQCVGYWRTHQRPGLYLDTRDLDLMATLFSQPWCVALCVRPPATAGFFLWENGDIHRTSSYREFELPEAEQPEMAPAPEPESRRRLRTQNWRRWAAAGAMAAVLAIAPFLLSSSSTSTPFNMLSMHAETGPGTVKLRWNPESKVLENASGAVIWIADGSEESKLELTSAQLRAGVLEYKPAGPDLNFRMEIGPFTESLRVSNVRPGDGVEYASARSRDEVDVAPQRETARSERRRRIQEAENAPVPATTEGPPAPAPAEETAREVEAPTPPPPPQIAMAPAKLERPPIQERAPEVPKVVATAEATGASPLKKVLGWIPGVRNKNYVPAKVVRQVQPRVASPRDTSVIVRVAIDSKGAVKNAALLTKGVDEQLGRSAVEAAKRWRFEPARSDDRAVASDMVLRFRFEGTRD